MATGRTVELATGITGVSSNVDTLVTQAADLLITQAGDFLVTQSTPTSSANAVTVAVASGDDKTVDLLAGLAATSLQIDRLVTQAGNQLVTQANDPLILQQKSAATGSSILVPSVTVTGS